MRSRRMPHVRLGPNNAHYQTQMGRNPPDWRTFRLAAITHLRAGDCSYANAAYPPLGPSLRNVCRGQRDIGHHIRHDGWRRALRGCVREDAEVHPTARVAEHRQRHGGRHGVGAKRD